MEPLRRPLFDVNTLVYGETMNERLTRSDWIQHGLRTLAAEGAGALKVGPMASGLGVSRGSFYWHFEDVAAFRAELLQAWREQATDRVIRRLSERTTPDRLNYLLKGAFSEDRTLDRAVRSWAAEDAEAAAVVTSVDASRVAYIAKLLTEAGVDAGKDPRHATIDPSAIDDIGDLFEA
jgi:AcrR family transcriptional regulator